MEDKRIIKYPNSKLTSTREIHFGNVSFSPSNPRQPAIALYTSTILHIRGNLQFTEASQLTTVEWGRIPMRSKGEHINSVQTASVIRIKPGSGELQGRNSTAVLLRHPMWRKKRTKSTTINLNTRKFFNPNTCPTLTIKA